LKKSFQGFLFLTQAFEDVTDGIALGIQVFAGEFHPIQRWGHGCARLGAQGIRRHAGLPVVVAQVFEEQAAFALVLAQLGG
jgi:hypothetical protein